MLSSCQAMKAAALAAAMFAASGARGDTIPRAAASDPVPGQKGPIRALIGKWFFPSDPTPREIVWRMEAEAIRLATVKARAEAEARSAVQGMRGIQAMLGEQYGRAVAVEADCGPALMAPRSAAPAGVPASSWGATEEAELKLLLKQLIAELERQGRARPVAHPLPMPRAND